MEQQQAAGLMEWLDGQCGHTLMDNVMEQLQGSGLEAGALYTAAAAPVAIRLQVIQEISVPDYPGVPNNINPQQGCNSLPSVGAGGRGCFGQHACCSGYGGDEQHRYHE